MRIIHTVAVLLAIPAVASAQDIFDVSSLSALDEADVVTQDGENLGEVENVLIDAGGTPVAIVVEAGGFLGIGDSDRVIPLDRLTWDNGNYMVNITREEVEALPEWDD
ncbi:PRC-barrel domain-containing protein [Roseitranquillus sediminis]|uniref:PRC-barrel domain-containing protein n=1 Tax=Roseitranquillus sediminis TaxID=2809051 RepID=UPI001D0CBDEE|nr:PRC-barrel domain-containing protein [Roseitranquillus sediminis]MBM9596096.1 PRC-barrel domain-containing protein [Roseitranquillus sediminis]